MSNSPASLHDEIREVAAPLIREVVLTYLRALAATWELNALRAELAGKQLSASVADAGLPHMPFSPQLIGGGQQSKANTRGMYDEMRIIEATGKIITERRPAILRIAAALESQTILSEADALRLYRG